MQSLGQQDFTRPDKGQAEDSRSRTIRCEPREVAEHRAAALRAIRVYARTCGVSLAKAREAYAAGKVEVSDETRLAVPRVTATTFKRWSRNFKAKKLNGLQPPRGNRAGSGVMDINAELADFAIAMLGQNHLLSAKNIWRAMQTYFVSGERLPSCGAFRRWMLRWKRTHREHFERISNPDAHKKFMVALGDKAAEVTAPLEIVEIDGSPADIFCVDGRYYLTVAIDVFSRRKVAVVSKTASATAALFCLRKLILTLGVPRTLRHDRGKEYLAARFQAALANCEIASDPVPPFSGDKKPFVERAIGTIMHSFMPLLPGFIGANVGERRDIEARQTFAKRLGQDRTERFDVRLTAHELQQRLDGWLATDDSASQRWRDAVAAGWVARRLPERELDILLADVGFRTVGKKGIRIDRADFWHDNLAAYLGSTVRVALTEDMGQIVVFTREHQFIAVAVNPERAGVDRREMAISASAAWRSHQRDARKRDRALKAKFTPARVLDAMTASRAGGASPLTRVEMADVPLLQAARDAIAAGKDVRPAGPPIQTAASSDQQWKIYQRIKSKPAQSWTEDEAERVRIYEASAAFRVRTTFGAVA